MNAIKVVWSVMMCQCIGMLSLYVFDYYVKHVTVWNSLSYFEQVAVPGLIFAVVLICYAVKSWGRRTTPILMVLDLVMGVGVGLVAPLLMYWRWIVYDTPSTIVIMRVFPGAYNEIWLPALLMGCVCSLCLLISRFSYGFFFTTYLSTDRN